MQKKDYEILSFVFSDGGSEYPVLMKNDNGTFGVYKTDEQTLLNTPLHGIHSVKRLSDGEVFTIGDRVIFDTMYKSSIGVIRSFNSERSVSDVLVAISCIDSFTYLRYCGNVKKYTQEEKYDSIPIEMLVRCLESKK